MLNLKITFFYLLSLLRYSGSNIVEYSNFRRRIEKLADCMLFRLVMQNVILASLYLLSLSRYGGLNLSSFDILDAEIRNSQIICYSSR